MKLGFRSYGNSVCVFLFLATFMVGAVFAQDYRSMGISDVVGSADLFLQRGDYANAIEPLEEVISRTRKLTDPLGMETLQSCRFQLARSFFRTGDTASGMEVLEKYLENEPRKQERMALRMMAKGFNETEKWDQIEKVAGRLLGLPDLEPEDILNANLLLGQSRFKQEKWEACVEPLTYATNHSKEERVRGLTQIMLVRALVESGNWRELYAWIPRLYRTDAKYDITLNLTLMKAGKARFESDDYLNALQLYRWVLPREALDNFATERISTLSKELAADVKIGIKESDRIERQKDIDDIKQAMDVLDKLPAYEDEVAFRIGQIYAEVKRYWEGYVLFDKLYKQDRASDIGEASMLQSVLILYDVLEIERAEERIIRYLDERPKGQYARTLLSIMMRDNLVKENLQKVIGLSKYLDTLPETTDSNELLLGADLHYMMAFGCFQNKDFGLAGKHFGVVVEKFPNSPKSADSLYYRGMANMLQGLYQKAKDDFALYQKKNENGEYYPSTMYRMAVCEFGLENIPLAEAGFTKFISTYPDSGLVSDAYSMRGDIEAAKDGNDDPSTPDVNEYDPHTLDRALADYRKAIDKAQLPQQASYAAFKAAEVYKLEFKWQEIVELMNYYLGLWEGKADVAQAVFWVGQSQIELGQVDEAVTAYREAIETYGNEVAQEGVDKIVLELVTIAEQHLAEEDREDLLVRLRLKLTSLESGSEVLKLRLKVALAMLKGKEARAALGAELLSAGQALSVTTPISLAVMCDAAVTAGDGEQMGRLFDYFTANFEESDEIWYAFRAKTYQLLAEKNLSAVLEIIDEVQGLFGADVFMAWAQIIKAETLYEMKKYKEADEAYNMIMGVSDWRGPTFAKAMFGRGQSHVKLDDYATAHSLFQRVYLLFRGYDEGKWAAMGYMNAADCLLKLGREADAVNTWNAMLEDEYVNTLPEAETAREMLKKYGGSL
jgi:TolA-binding protein